MDTNIEIQWVGHRRDGSSRGAIYGWFVEKGKPNHPRYPWSLDDCDESPAYIFRGRIGKKLHIEEKFLTSEFLAEISAIKKNYKTVEPEKIIKVWGKEFDEELSMFVTVLKLRG